MADMEQTEVERYRREIEHDLELVYGHYLRILEWDVPEADEGLARKLILDEMERALARMRLTPPSHRLGDTFMA